jgi:hypothetical protein
MSAKVRGLRAGCSELNRASKERNAAELRIEFTANPFYPRFSFGK